MTGLSLPSSVLRPEPVIHRDCVAASQQSALKGPFRHPRDSFPQRPLAQSSRPAVPQLIRSRRPATAGARRKRRPNKKPCTRQQRDTYGVHSSVANLERRGVVSPGWAKQIDRGWGAASTDGSFMCTPERSHHARPGRFSEGVRMNAAEAELRDQWSAAIEQLARSVLSSPADFTAMTLPGLLHGTMYQVHALSLAGSEQGAGRGNGG